MSKRTFKTLTIYMHLNAISMHRLNREEGCYLLKDDWMLLIDLENNKLQQLMEVLSSSFHVQSSALPVLSNVISNCVWHSCFPELRWLSCVFTLFAPAKNRLCVLVVSSFCDVLCQTSKQTNKKTNKITQPKVLLIWCWYIWPKLHFNSMFAEIQEWPTSKEK